MKFYWLKEKRGHIFHVQGVYFFHATLMLMHETPKIGLG